MRVRTVLQQVLDRYFYYDILSEQADQRRNPHDVPSNQLIINAPHEKPSRKTLTNIATQKV